MLYVRQFCVALICSSSSQRLTGQNCFVLITRNLIRTLKPLQSQLIRYVLSVGSLAVSEKHATNGSTTPTQISKFGWFFALGARRYQTCSRRGWYHVKPARC